MSYYPNEIHFIFELELQARRYFPKATFYLEVNTAPDDGSKALHFIVTHHWETSASEANEQMEKFTNEWYIHNMYRAEDLFIIDKLPAMPEE